jgi:hypothetical protein
MPKLYHEQTTSSDQNTILSTFFIGSHVEYWESSEPAKTENTDTTKICVVGETGISETHTGILRKIDEVISDPEMYDDGEAPPEQSIVRGVKRLLKNTKPYRGKITNRQLPDPIVRPYYGAVRVSWTTPRADVTLSYSDKKELRYIFHTSVVEGRSKNPGSTTVVTPSSLSKMLEWLISA